MYSVTIDGVNVDGMTVPGSASLRSVIGARATAGLTLRTTTAYRPVKGTEAYFYDTVAGRTAFGGVVSRARRRVIPGSEVREWTVSLVDFSALADRRRMYGAPVAGNSGDVVRWIIAHYLAEYGVTEGTIENGGPVTSGKVRYNGQRPSEGLNELAKNDGFYWTIDDAKRLHYLSPESYVAPFSLTDENPDYVELSIEDNLDDFCNVVFYRGSANGISDPRTEIYPGDGVRREFKLRYKVHQKPSVKVNGVPVASSDIGIKGIDSGKKWYWNEGEKLIVQDEAETVLSSSDALAVTYIGTYPIMVMLEDKESIAQRGRYETLVQDTSVPYLDTALIGAETKLRQNPFDRVDTSFRTYAPGLRAGMIIPVRLSDYDVDTQILITSVDADERTDAESSLEYSVDGVSGERREDWVDYYRQLSSRTSYEERPDETIMQVGKVEATCVLSMSASVIARPQAVFGEADGTGGSGFDEGDAFW